MLHIHDFVGLIIVFAKYGVPRDTDQSRDIDKKELGAFEMDVTVPLQILVQNSRLVIPGGKSGKVCSSYQIYR